MNRIVLAARGIAVALPAVSLGTAQAAADSGVDQMPRVVRGHISGGGTMRSTIKRLVQATVVGAACLVLLICSGTGCQRVGARQERGLAELVAFWCRSGCRVKMGWPRSARTILTSALSGAE
jgi:hypothetical protein